MADDEAPELSGGTGGSSRAASCQPSGSGLLAECDSGSEDEAPVEEFALDKQEAADTTALQHLQHRRDLQGIPWERLQVSRDTYRQQRLKQYRNYMNCIAEDEWEAVRAELRAAWPPPLTLPAAACPYAFSRNWRGVASSIVHFQLRNLLWASSAHDVFVVNDNRVQHWNSVTRCVEDVLDLRGLPKGPRIPGLGRVQVSTLCVSDGLIAAGGFTGELVLARLSRTDEEAEAEEEQQQQQEEEEDEGGAVEQSDWLQWGAAGTAGPGNQDHWVQTDSRLLKQQCCSIDTATATHVPLPDTQQQQQQHFSQQLPSQLAADFRLWQDQQQHHLCWPPPAQQAVQTCSSSWQQQPQWQQQQQQQQSQLDQQQQNQQLLGGTPQLHPRQHIKQRPQQQRPQLDRCHSDVVLGAAGPAAAEVLHSCRVTQSENGITNGIEIFNSCNYGHCVMTSNNDCCVRLFDVESGRPRQRIPFPFAVNYATLRPAGAAPGGGAVAAVVGDDPVTWLVDCRSGLEVMQLKGHRDFSFAAAWHPAGQLLATGNQDSTTHVWDVRNSSTPLAVLAGTMGAIRSLRFSPDGAFLAAAEPADFVHVYDVASGFAQSQEIDLFGEVAGISFSPGQAQCLFVAVSDALYSSLLHFTRTTDRC